LVVALPVAEAAVPLAEVAVVEEPLSPRNMLPAVAVAEHRLVAEVAVVLPAVAEEVAPCSTHSNTADSSTTSDTVRRVAVDSIPHTLEAAPRNCTEGNWRNPRHTPVRLNPD